MSAEQGRSSQRLQGRTALITGASRGIGYAIAEAFAREGADLVISATNEVALIEAKSALEAHGVAVSYCVADVASESAISNLFAFAVAQHPELDVLVNNAGIHIGRPFTDYAMEEFDRLMRINVYSVFQLTQMAIAHMQQLGRGKVINISSTAGKWESMNQAAYNASKHAVVGLTKCVALENAKNHINVNAICPGIVETDIIRNAQQQMAATGMAKDEFQTAIESQIPMGRMLQVNEIAPIATYLASAESDGMTGQTITISGGMRMG
ncbi:MAG: SDR family oxidoreductase [Proteobacteria bacterium]|nr:SDR family oxidoreductase [Pseudomonadota bacterium]